MKLSDAQVFKLFLKVLRKKLSVALIYIGVFLVVAFGLASSGSSDEKFEQSRLDICVFDEDNTDESRALIAYLGRNNDIKTMEKDRDAIIDALYYESINYVLTIKNGYGSALAGGEVGDMEGKLESMHMHDSFSNVYVNNLLNEYTSAVQAYRAAGCEGPEALAKAEEALSTETEVTMVSFEAEENSEYSRALANFYQYMPYIMISVVISVLSPVLLTVNRKDVRFRTNCSSISTVSYTRQIFAGSIVFILAAWLVFTIAGMAINGGAYSGRAWYAALNSLVFMVVAAGISILIATVVSSPKIVDLLTQIIGLGMSFFCGVFVPQSMLGSGVLAAAKFLPAYWYIRINDMLAGREAFVGSKVQLYFVIEAAFAAVLGVLCALITKLRREKAI